MLLRIEAPHFVAGVEPGVCAAPIIKYMRDWSVEKIAQYCALKSWTVTTQATVAPNADRWRVMYGTSE